MRTPTDTPEFIPARLTAARYAVTIRTLDRWLADPTVGLPRPVYLGRLRFWRVADLAAWEAEASARADEAAA